MIGRTIHNFHIDSLIGEGGMGVVYKATDVELGRIVAIKVLHSHLMKDKVFFERFKNEAVLLAQLSHPNVTTLYNFFTEDDQSFMVMEYVQGKSLEGYVGEGKRLDYKDIISVVAAVLNGLEHAHEHGILHRDIKPGNVMLSSTGVVKLMDFGIAKMKGARRVTKAGNVVGTLEYLAPELLSGKEPSVQSDLYAVGVLLYELLCGNLPFDGNTEASLIHNILHQKPQALRKDIPIELSRILDSLLSKNPDQRPSSAVQLRKLLDNISLKEEKKVEHSKVLPRVKIDLKLASLINSLKSTEGLIILGGLVVAVLVLVLGTTNFSDDPEVSPTAEKLNVPADTVVFDVNEDKTSPISQEREYKKLNQTPPTDLPRIFEEEKPTPKKETKKVEKERVPTKKIPEAVFDQVIAPTTDAGQPATEKKAEPLIQISEERRAGVRMFSLINLSVPLVLDETLSSDEVFSGKTIAFRVASNVLKDGTVIIAAGASATGVVVKAKSSVGSGKSFLEIKPEKVKAVNGEYINLKSPALGKTGTSKEPVIFNKGTRISPDPKAVDRTISINL